MAYSITSITDDCYPGTTCLINKLDIHDEAMLANAEASLVLAKASFLDQHPIMAAMILSTISRYITICFATCMIGLEKYER